MALLAARKAYLKKIRSFENGDFPSNIFLMNSVYVIGHRNPDVDSICSAIGYAALKRECGFKNFTAARCGNSNARIDRVLSKFGVALPQLIGDVRVRAKNVMRRDFISMPADASCYAVMDSIDKNDLRSIPLVDSAMKLLGEVSVFDLGEFFIPRPKDIRQTRRLSATLNDVIKTLDATVHCIFRPDETEDMFVRIGAMEVSTFGSFIDKEGLRPEQNLIVVGDRFDIQIKAVQMNVRGIIITGGYDIDESVLEMARLRKVSVISCPYDSATTALLVRMATRAQPLARKNPIAVTRDMLLSKISERAKDYFGKTIYVCDQNGKVEGIFTNTDLLDFRRPKIVLVDHNEISQAVIGADEAEIVEVIDHHRIGDARTSNPILFLNKPVGSTCTIVSQMYAAFGFRPDKKIAGLLLSGIICDTLNLKSPTATAEDAAEVKKLSKLAGISADELAEFIFRSDSIVMTLTPEKVISSDCKFYEEAGQKFSVSQIEELDFASFLSKLENLRSALENFRAKNKLIFSALFVTNVMTQDSLLLMASSEDFSSKISFTKDAEKNVFELPKIVSRKKQLVPYLTSLLHDL